MAEPKPTKGLILKKTLALSDLHLGRKHSRLKKAKDLKPLLEGFEQIMLLGDILDLWYLTKTNAQELEGQLRETCREAGAKKVQWFRGNHDASIEDACEFVLDHHVMYFHGHAIFSKLLGEGNIEARIQILNKKHYGDHRHGSRHGKSSWTWVEKAYASIPQRMLTPLMWNPILKRRLLLMAHEVGGIEAKIRGLPDHKPMLPGGPVRAAVFGHSHCPGVRKFKGLTVFNLGGWVSNTRACGFIQEGRQGRLVMIENLRHPHWGKVLHEAHI